MKKQEVRSQEKSIFDYQTKATKVLSKMTVPLEHLSRIAHFQNPLFEAQLKITESLGHVQKMANKMISFDTTIRLTSNNLLTNEAVNSLKMFQAKSIEIQENWTRLAGMDKIPNYNLSKYTIPESLNNALNAYRRFQHSIELQNTKLLEVAEQSALIYQKIEGSSELQFAFIANLQLSGDKDVETFVNSLKKEKPEKFVEEWETKLDEFMLPLLVKHGMVDLWLGAQYALGKNDNPDKLRHALISLRTLLEHVIEIKFAQKSQNKSRTKKIEDVLAKFELHYLDEIEPQGINYIGSCYATLCNLHQLEVGLTENQVKVLKAKTGVIIWFLISLYDILNEGSGDSKITVKKQKIKKRIN